MLTDLSVSYETIWFLGDEFLTKASGHLPADEQAVKDFYIRRNYKVKFFTDNSLSLVNSITGRIRNTLVKAIKENPLLPRIIVVMLDDNMVADITLHYSYIFGALFHWLVMEIDRVVESHKDYLLVKGRKQDYPSFIWISPPQNVNFQNNGIQQKMDKVMKNTLEKLKGHIMLRLKKVWKYEDHFYFDQFYTKKGMTHYWKSVDSTTQFWDRHLAPKSMGFTHLAQQHQPCEGTSGAGDWGDPFKAMFSQKQKSFHQGGKFHHNHKFHQGGVQRWGEVTFQNDKYHWRMQQHSHSRKLLPKPHPF